MKLPNGREFSASPAWGHRKDPDDAPIVEIVVRQFGLNLASQVVTANQAREFAGELLAAADSAEGGVL